MRRLVAILLATSGCWWMDPNVPDERAAFDDIAECREEARAHFYDAGDATDAEMAFERCLKRKGL